VSKQEPRWVVWIDSPPRIVCTKSATLVYRLEHTDNRSLPIPHSR
jgi:hypothetical protein